MSDAELLELYAVYVDTFAANLGMAITLIFAFLAATFVTAKRLSAFQFYMTSSLFAVFTMSVVMGAYDMAKRTASIQSELARRISAEGSEIKFIAVDGMPEFLPPFILGVFVMAIILSLVFALNQRRHDG